VVFRKNPPPPPKPGLADPAPRSPTPADAASTPICCPAGQNIASFRRPLVCSVMFSLMN
jgi:hypothetical protein